MSSIISEKTNGAASQKYQPIPSSELDATHTTDNTSCDQESRYAPSLPANGQVWESQQLIHSSHDIESGLKRERHTFPLILLFILSILIIALSTRHVVMHLGDCATHMSSKTTATASFLAS